MSGIIDLLNARKARNAAMLNPGKTSGSGGSSLIKSSSLQPQTVFRQTKASFSVKRPAMTVMRESSLHSFSRQSEAKYNDGFKLLHLKPASSANNQTVQRVPASMPLPSAGISAAPQTAAESSAPASSPAMSNLGGYPPQSERRPVMFEKTDGPSDFEKRIMAAKKQKAEQAAKQRGPDRRRVRTERVEISSSDSGEVNRDFAPFDPAKDQQSAATGQSAVIQREMLDTRRGSGKSSAADTVQREMNVPRRRSGQDFADPGINQRDFPLSDHSSQNDGHASLVQREIDFPQTKPLDPAAKPLKPAVVQRETAEHQAKPPVQASEIKSTAAVQREADFAQAKPMAPASETKTTAAVQREVDFTQTEPLDTASEPEKPSTVQREPDFAKAKPLAAASEPEKPATVQQEPDFAKAKPLAAAPKPEKPATVQREPDFAQAKPLNTVSKPEKPATVQRGPDFARAKPLAAASEPEKPSTVQREPDIAQSKPLAAASEPEKPSTVQREPDFAKAKPLDTVSEPAKPATVQPEPDFAQAKPLDTTSEPTKPAAVQRKSDFAQAKPLDTTSEPAKPAAVQRESDFAQAKPLDSADEPEKPSTVQRELDFAQAKPLDTAVEPAKAATVQREPDIAQAKSLDTTPDPAKPAIVQRELDFAQAKPMDTISDPEKPEAVQREDNIPQARLLDPAAKPETAGTVQRELSVPEAKPAARNEKPSVNGQNQPLIPQAQPVGNEPDVIQREFAKPDLSPKDRSADSEPMRDLAASAANTVQRTISDAGEDLHSLLKNLPSHYEMPQEQIEAIRSGKPYGSPAGPSNSETPKVQRESDFSLQKNEKRQTPKSSPDKQTAAASVQNSVQREPEFTLPKANKKQASQSKADEAVVQREPASYQQDPSDMRAQAPRHSDKSAQNTPLSSWNMMPGQRGGFTNTQSSGVIQREMQDSGSQSSLGKQMAQEMDEKEETAEVVKKLEEQLHEVNIRELDVLANKLLPRIKRIMQNEMERSIFR